jgi:putative FmdB family regulatory protein
MYEYECQACHHRFEKIQRFSDAPIKKCPKCGKAKLEKLISKSSVQFKGTGWYVTDYAGKKGEAPVESKSDDKSADTKTETKTETKSETKSEAGSETKSETSDKPKKKESNKKTKSDS